MLEVRDHLFTTNSPDSFRPLDGEGLTGGGGGGGGGGRELKTHKCHLTIPSFFFWCYIM